MSVELQPPTLIQRVTRDGKPGLSFNLHPGQQKAWDSTKQIVAVIAGVRAGKTSFMPLWLYREMMRRGPGDALAAAPFFTILEKALEPEINNFFGRLLRLGSPSGRSFVISEDGHKRLWPGQPVERTRRIIYGHADKPESLAAMGVKCAVLDEVGQKSFRIGAFREIQMRLAFDRGRMLIATRPYDLGWLKKEIHDEWTAAGGQHPEIDVINFDSTENPAFPVEEFERARRTLPLWLFDMAYRGRFTRPVGLIYDNFDKKHHVRPRRRIPEEWPRFVGMDFGAVNTAALFLAQELSPTTRVPTGKFVAYREYLPGKLSTDTHRVNLLAGDPDRGIPPEPREPTCVGGSRSEDEWRLKFRDSGLAVMEPPVNAVEVQIQALYELIGSGNLEVMEDMVGLLDELESYSRVLDDQGRPTEKIDSDHAYHWLACARYVTTWLLRGGSDTFIPTPITQDNRSVIHDAPPGVVMEEERHRHHDHGSHRRGWLDPLAQVPLPSWRRPRATAARVEG